MQKNQTRKFAWLFGKSRRPGNLLSKLAGLVALGSASLMLIGHTNHLRRLGLWGVSADLFPKPPEWLLINGYYGIVGKIVLIFSRVGERPANLAGVATYVLMMLIFVYMPKSDGETALSRWFTRPTSVGGDFLRAAVLSAATLILLPMTILFAALFMVLPVAFGEKAGRYSAQQDALSYHHGCDQLERHCLELWRGEKRIAQGFEIDRSPSHMALFDVPTQSVRVVALDGIELVSGNASKSWMRLNSKQLVE